MRYINEGWSTLFESVFPGPVLSCGPVMGLCGPGADQAIHGHVVTLPGMCGPESKTIREFGSLPFPVRRTVPGRQKNERAAPPPNGAGKKKRFQNTKSDPVARITFIQEAPEVYSQRFILLWSINDTARSGSNVRPFLRSRGFLQRGWTSIPPGSFPLRSRVIPPVRIQRRSGQPALG